MLDLCSLFLHLSNLRSIKDEKGRMKRFLSVLWSFLTISIRFRIPRLGCHFFQCVFCYLCGTFWSWETTILGDPGAVSRVGRKEGTKLFKYGRKSPWVPPLTELFPKIQADAGSWSGTKNALYYWAQSANSFSRLLFVSSYTTAIVSPHLPGSFTNASLRVQPQAAQAHYV